MYLSATKVNENLPTGVTQEQIDSFVKKNEDYIPHQVLDYPCPSGQGMRSKIVLRHRLSIVKIMNHPTLDASIEIIAFGNKEIEEKFTEWCESV